jgi:crossover junction endodeoxyribonuclease RuvC
VTCVIGIDPGQSGAIALYWPREVRVEIHDMPMVANSQNGKPELDYGAVIDLLREDGAVAWLEQVASRPGQGVSSVFRFGMMFGGLQACAAAAKTPLRLVTPGKWKKALGLCAEKGAARQLAMQRLPHVADHFRRVKDDGRAEAALIALYGAGYRA